jgi:hypothetical protein
LYSSENLDFYLFFGTLCFVLRSEQNQRVILMIADLHNLYSSQNIIRKIKSDIVRWAGHVARTEDKRIVYKVLGEKARRKDTTRKTEA